MPTRPRILAMLVTASLILSISALAAINRLSRLGPASATLTAWNNSTASADQALSISSATANGRLCLSKMSFVANSTATVRILDGGTTVYAVDLAADTPLYEVWDNDDMCGTAATKLHVKISTGIRQTTLGSQFLNYSGFTY